MAEIADDIVKVLLDLQSGPLLNESERIARSMDTTHRAGRRALVDGGRAGTLIAGATAVGAGRGSAQGEGAAGAAGGGRPDRPKRTPGRAEKKRPFFYFGSEGARVGNVRISRSGVTLPEKYFLGGVAGLGAVAAAGQLTGLAMQQAVKVRDKVRQGESVWSAVAQAPIEAGLRIGGLAFSLFGIDRIVKAGLALFADTSEAVANRAIQETLADFSGTSRKYKEDLAKDYVAYQSDALRRDLQARQKVAATRSAEVPTDGLSQQARFDEWSRRDGFEAQRLGVRDIRGRPTWDVARVDYVAVGS